VITGALALLACGGGLEVAVDPDRPDVHASSAPPTRVAPSQAATPGWTDVSPAPARRAGTLDLRVVGDDIVAQLRLGPGDRPSSALSVWFEEDPSTPRRLLGTLAPEGGATFRTTGCTVDHRGPVVGRVIVTEGAEATLVGVSRRDRALFPASVQSDFDVHLRCEGGGKDTRLPPLTLEADPRLPLAVCAAPCALDPFPEVRLTSASAVVDPEGHVQLRASPAFQPEGETPELTVNGVVATRLSPAAWDADFGSVTAPPLRAGPNAVCWSLGRRPRGCGTVVLPSAPLAPRSTPFRVGAPFVVEVDGAPWTTSYQLSVDPPPEKISRAGQFVVSASPRIEGVFAGLPGAPTRVALRVTVQREDAGMTVSRTEVAYANVEAPSP
jgi:hypothetical protein